MTFSNDKFHLVSYADDLCISFGVDKHYNYKLIEVVYQHLRANN